MHKKLFIGDPHAQPSNLKECEKLISFIIQLAKDHDVDEVLLSGDLGHTHGVLNVRVQDFWRRSFERLVNETKADIVALVGNHDMPGDKESEGKISGLDLFSLISDRITIVDRPTYRNDAGYLPYYSSNERFIEEANKVFDDGFKFLYCHQTIQGSKYDNGMYAPDGADLSKVKPFTKIVSGHIHSHQEFANVIYPGTPKWDTASDANLSKGVFLIEQSDNFSIKMFSTENVVTSIKKFSILEGEDLPVLPENSINVVELIGSSTWIGSTAKKLKGKCRLLTKPTDSASRRALVKVSSRIEEFADTFTFPSEVSRDKVLEYVRSL